MELLLFAQTVKELPNERFRREEKCEREPSGFPFTFNNPAAAGKIAKESSLFLFCNFESSLSEKSARTFLTSCVTAKGRD